ncbi:MAG: transcriptional repressor LexA [Acidobacteriota bacterium]
MVTPRQRQIYDYLCRYADAHSYAPTMAEIGKQFKLSSPASVHHILAGLEREGLIRRIPNVSRGIEVVREEASEQDFEIPLLGVVAAGQPIEAILSHETICVPRDFMGRERLFALRVRGDSMIGEQIREGDCIIVESRQTANNGEMVVALVDGSDATVKTFFKERNQIRLEPANPRYKPIIVSPPDRVTIQGVVKGLIRKYKR